MMVEVVEGTEKKTEIQRQCQYDKKRKGHLFQVHARPPWLVSQSGSVPIGVVPSVKRSKDLRL